MNAACANAIQTTYSWLLETATPGVLSNGRVSLPAPTWTVIPAAPQPVGQPPATPVVAAQVVAPAPEAQDRFGEAIWVKVFTTELENEVGLEELVGDNAKVDQAETEIEWQLLQVDPGNPDSGKLESGYGVPVGPKAASILRRDEFFKYPASMIRSPTKHWWGAIRTRRWMRSVPTWVPRMPH